MHSLPAAVVRNVIARLGDAPTADRRIGTIELRAHQLDAVARLREMLDRTGGALLADEAGLGKTYVALAVAATARAPMIVAPASLRAMWSAAMEATRVRATFDTYERLSRSRAHRSQRRGARPQADAPFPGDYDLVVLDEAHHARNPATRRYGAVAELTVGAGVLLLSATPVHNRRRDLEALVALYLGGRAATLTDEELSAHVYRRERASIGLAIGIPEAQAPVWLSLPHDDGLLEALLALPPPLPPADGGDGGALLVHGLVRQWASTDGALRGALGRRAARAGALIDALAAGRHLTRAELRSWTFGDGAVQLAFPELMAAGTAPDAAELLRAVQVHLEAVSPLRQLLRSRPGFDAERARLIRAVRSQHRNEKVIAFTSYAESAAVLFRELARDGGVAMLTADGGRVAGGALTRRQTLQRFAPLAHGVQPPSEAERIDLLLATDLLSEGVNLQDASVVIHLDLPWTPARLEQRVGRAARLGSLHHRVAVYALTPPASAERLIEVEERLRQKLTVAREAVGGLKAVLPPPGQARSGDSSAERPADVIRQALARWCSLPETAATIIGPDAFASVHAADEGFLAAIETVTGTVLVAGLGTEVGTCSDLVARAVMMAEGPDCEVDPVHLEASVTAIARWGASEHAARSAGVGAAEPLRRRIVSRIAGIARRTPVHRRPIVARLSAAARDAASTSMGAGAERRLAELAAAQMPDEEWLSAVARFPSHEPVKAPREQDTRIIGILLLRRAMSEIG